MYGFETWSLTLKEGHTLSVSENRRLRGMLGPKRKEVARGWRRLNNEELRNFYALPNIIRVIKARSMRGVGHVARMGGMMNAYKTLDDNLNEETTRRSRCR
jgi:hypothetical protein